MRSLLLILLFPLWLQAAVSPLIVTSNDWVFTFNSSSYDTTPYHLWGHYMGAHMACMYPQYTNHWYSISRSGANWENDNTNQLQKYGLALWANGTGRHIALVLANDNGGYTSNQTWVQGTNMVQAPAIMSDGGPLPYTTQSGWCSTNTVSFYFLGRIPNDSADGNSGSIAGNAAATNLAGFYGTPIVDQWNLQWTNALSNDVVGARQWGFYSGGHPYPAGHLCMTLLTMRALGAETNVSLATLDFANASVSSTQSCTISSVSLAGQTLTFTRHDDRMPGAWDVPDGTITNDARNAFVLMPFLTTAFNYNLTVTNVVSGNHYALTLDGTLIDTQLASASSVTFNLFTNYTGTLWAQRKEILGRVRDQRGCDRVTLLDHSAGSNGVLNNKKDMVNYQSQAGVPWAAGTRGDALITALTNNTVQITLYDNYTAAAAQQTNHIFTVTRLEQGSSLLSGNTVLSGRSTLQ